MLRKLGFGALTALILALITLNVLAWSGGLIDEERAPTPQAAVAIAPPAATQEPELAENQPIARKRPAKRAARKEQPNATALVLVATRGDCWVEVRAGSATGRSLYSGTLASGRTLKFNRPKIWLRLGAASNVDLVVNGRPSTVPSGTVELTLPDA